MYYKVDIEINWTTTLGYVILCENEYDNIVAKLKKAIGKEISFSYCADGDDCYVDFDKSIEEILDLFNHAKKISDEEYEVFKKYDCLCSSDTADNLYYQLCNELDDMEDDEEE